MLQLIDAESLIGPSLLAAYCICDKLAVGAIKADVFLHGLSGPQYFGRIHKDFKKALTAYCNILVLENRASV